MSEYSKKAKETLDLLRANPEWIERYKNYADEISGNVAMLKERKASFHKWNPLYVYLTTSEMKKSGSISFSLRYKGQEVGKLVVKDEILCYPAYENNEKNFGYTTSFQGEFPWNSENAREFRKFFSGNPVRENNGKKNEEHRYESMLLTAFEDRNKEIEEFKRIRPVSIIPGVRFPMPTPISASDKKTVTYSGAYGGGIDIFTRTGKGRATYLNIMELKDENRKGEEPYVVIKQAIAYATFILQLLRDDSCGEAWYKLFGFKSPLPETLKVYATCLMPKGDCEDKGFANEKIYIHKKTQAVSDAFQEDSDIIELHYMYFNENDGVISNVETSLR